MNTLPTDPVAKAIRDLKCFGAISRSTARRLLESYAHRVDLTKAQRKAVVESFPELTR